MTGVLDTSVLIALELGQLGLDDVPQTATVSTVTLSELRLGVLATTGREHQRRSLTLNKVLDSFEVAPVTWEIAEAVADIRAEGRRRGVTCKPFDSCIGATGRVLGLPVFTRDRGFEGMAGVDVRLV